MPLLSITVRGAELLKKVHIKLEQNYNFTMLKLLHCYHNIDSHNLSDSVEKLGQALLFCKLGNLVANAGQITNFIGDYNVEVAHPTSHVYTYDSAGTPSLTPPVSTTRIEPDLDINHLIPLGGTKNNSTELISRDVFKVLHQNSVLQNNGEIDFELFYINKDAGLSVFDSSSGGIVTASTSHPVSFLTLLFEYETL